MIILIIIIITLINFICGQNITIINCIFNTFLTLSPEMSLRYTNKINIR